VRGSRVGPDVRQRLETGIMLADLVHRVEQIPRGPGQPIETGHHQHVALAQAVYGLAQESLELRTTAQRQRPPAVQSG
jgi:hypothetical protein